MAYWPAAPERAEDIDRPESLLIVGASSADQLIEKLATNNKPNAKRKDLIPIFIIETVQMDLSYSWILADIQQSIKVKVQYS